MAENLQRSEKTPETFVTSGAKTGRMASRLCAVALLAAALCHPVSESRAADFDGISLPGSVLVYDQKLMLNGCGMREIMWQDIYLIALYLPSADRDPASIRDRNVTKALRLEIVYDGNTPDKLPSEWREHLKSEISKEMMGLVRGMYRSFEAGDVVFIAEHADKGTTIEVNGETVQKGTDTELVPALLNLWIGSDAVSRNLRRLLLQGSC